MNEHCWNADTGQWTAKGFGANHKMSGTKIMKNPHSKISNVSGRCLFMNVLFKTIILQTHILPSYDEGP